MSERSFPMILIGYRGSGKSTIGRLLAQRLACDFADADVVLEQQAGKTIREIFASHGEQHFRDLEEQTITQLLERPRLVLATGGGAILRETNRQRMKARGWIIWLSAPADVLYQRMQQDATTAERRPNLVGGGIEEVQAMLQIRTPIYQRLADLEIPVGEMSPEVAVDRILAQWQATGTTLSSIAPLT